MYVKCVLAGGNSNFTTGKIYKIRKGIKNSNIGSGTYFEIEDNYGIVRTQYLEIPKPIKHMVLTIWELLI